MNITVYYRSGKTIEFTTDSLTSADPLTTDAGSGSKNLVTEFDLRLDTIESQGLLLEIFWYNSKRYEDSAQDIVTGRYFASLEENRIVRLISQKEMQEVSEVYVNDKLVFGRIGDEIINFIKFRNQELLCYSADPMASYNKKACDMYIYFKNVNPQASVAEIADKIGYSEAALLRALRDEAIQNPDEEGYVRAKF